MQTDPPFVREFRNDRKIFLKIMNFLLRVFSLIARMVAWYRPGKIVSRAHTAWYKSSEKDFGLSQYLYVRKSSGYRL
jgi:hypothetical protein